MLVVMSPQHRYHVSLFVMRVIMAATFLGLRNFALDYVFFELRYRSISLHRRNDVFLATTGAHVSFLIDLSLLGTNMAVRVCCCPREI